MIVLGIETSCDETSASVIDGRGDDVVFRSLVILSQDVHRIFGGVVPELASRAHLTSIVPVTKRALEEAGVQLSGIDAIAVTNAPGLIGALLVGVSYAKSLAHALGVPVLGVHHMEGHIFAAALEHPDAVPPFTALLVSGGHTMLLDVEAWGSYRLLGGTRDDAAGEAFDKVAKLLGMPYPGGRHVEAMAKGGNPARFQFSRPMVQRSATVEHPDHFAFSFSGLKTAVLNAVRGSGAIETDAPDIARGFQDAMIDTLVEKTRRAAIAFGRRRVIFGGGVACNGTLATAARERLGRDGIELFTPSVRLATDNAAMIARAGYFRLDRGERSDSSLNAYASLPLPGLLP